MRDIELEIYKIKFIPKFDAKSDNNFLKTWL